ncbi:MAG: hypothetical protein WAV73_04440 [Candidatus Moraniibacteriota bacterium]
MKKIIKISLAFFGVVFLVGCGKQSTNQAQPVVSTPAVNQSANNQLDAAKQCQNFPPPSFCPGGVGDIIVTGTDNDGCSIYGCKPGQEGQVYKNEKYGFQLTLPKGWENYKALANETTGSKNVVAYVYIDLPTSEKTWPGDTDPATGKSFMGYASMFAITVWSTDGYAAELKRCKTESDPGCPGADVVSVKSDRYVFSIRGPQAMPEDLQKSMGGGYIEKIKQSFKLANSADQGIETADKCNISSKDACEAKSECFWKDAGGKKESHYSCCPKDVESSPERCRIMVD